MSAMNHNESFNFCSCRASKIGAFEVREGGCISGDLYVKFVERSLELSNQAVLKGNHPFGALIVYPSNATTQCATCRKDSYWILEAENTVHTGNDVTHHAELNLISRAWKLLSADQRAKCVLITSTEPCAMC